jgi:hypothetical protein
MNSLRTRVALPALAAGALLALAGCGESRGEIDGKVALDGKTVPGGVVKVYPSKDANPETPGQPLTTAILQDGTFVVTNVPTGPAQITVEEHLRLSPIGGGKAPGADERFMPIPARYKDKAKSGLSIDVKSGKQPLDLQLKSEG